MVGGTRRAPPRLTAHGVCSLRSGESLIFAETRRNATPGGKIPNRPPCDGTRPPAGTGNLPQTDCKGEWVRQFCLPFSPRRFGKTAIDHQCGDLRLHERCNTLRLQLTSTGGGGYSSHFQLHTAHAEQCCTILKPDHRAGVPARPPALPFRGSDSRSCRQRREAAYGPGGR